MSKLFCLQFVFALLVGLFYNANSANAPVPFSLDYFVSQITYGISAIVKSAIDDASVISKKKNLLVSIESEGSVEYYPLLGTFEVTKKCKKLRVILFEAETGTFNVGNIFCNDLVSMRAINGVLDIRPSILRESRDYRSERSRSRTRSSLRSSEFMSIFKNMDVKDIPDCPAKVKSLKREIIPGNFDPANDQQYIAPVPPVNFKGFYKHGTGIVQIDDEKTLMYLVFESSKLQYAVPSDIGCKCTVNNTTIDCKCEKISYQYDLLEGVMSVEETKLFTNNVKGKKIMVENSLDRLISSLGDVFETAE